jgi:hypothetical protein
LFDAPGNAAAGGCGRCGRGNSLGCAHAEIHRSGHPAIRERQNIRIAAPADGRISVRS